MKQSAVESWDEPKTKWGKSKARKLLYKGILDGRVPRKATDEAGKRTAKLIDFYNSWDEFKLYHYSKFSRRLGTLQSQIEERLARKDLDQEAFDNYVANHPVSLFSHKGYIQWQGSHAQALALEHIQQNIHNTTKWATWHGEHPEYYQNFPLDAFKDKIRQELRTLSTFTHLKREAKTLERQRIGWLITQTSS